MNVTVVKRSAIEPRAVKWILLVASLLFWAVIGVRVGASRWGRPAPDPDAASNAASETIVSPKSRLVLWLTGTTMNANWILLVLWSIAPTLAGPALRRPSLPLQLAGIGLMGAGIGLMSWAYLVFRSFRLLPHIEPGHELCEDGPFAWLRHPIYTGIDLFYLGTFLMVPRLGLLIQVIANVVAFDLRARAEEEVLMRAFGDQYCRFMARTRRFVPGVY